MNRSFRPSVTTVVLLHLVLLFAILLLITRFPATEEARAAILNGPIVGRGATYVNVSLHLLATLKFAIAISTRPVVGRVGGWLAAVGATQWLVGDALPLMLVAGCAASLWTDGRKGSPAVPLQRRRLRSLRSSGPTDASANR